MTSRECDCSLAVRSLAAVRRWWLGVFARLHARDDVRALLHGWDIEVIQGGTGRRYRDPRFDRFRNPAE